MAQHKRLIGVVFGVALFVLLMGVSIGRAGPQPFGAAPVTIRPLQSTLANPAQLSSCVDKAIQFTNVAYPSDQPITLWLARQVTDAQLAKQAPNVSREIRFGVLMNLVVLKGNFHHPRSPAPLPYIVYVLLPYPDCSPTITTFNVKDFGLQNPAQ